MDDTTATTEVTAEVTSAVAVADTSKVAETTASTETTAETPEPKTDAAPQPVVLDKFYESFTTNGKLSETDYTELATMGFPKEMVDTYIAGQASVITQADQDAMLAGIGGKESFDQIAKWAGKALSDDELTEFNAALANKQAAPFALKTLKARMEAEEGKPPTTKLEGDTSKVPATPGFKTQAEMKNAMKDTRYSGLRRDPAYVKWVETMTAKSSF